MARIKQLCNYVGLDELLRAPIPFAYGVSMRDPSVSG